MSKDFNAYTKQCASYQNNKVTLAVYGNLQPASENRFAEILDGTNSKIKITINDFQKGKGDLATKVYYNLSVTELNFIFDKFKANSLPEFKGIKSLDTYLEQDGPYKGLAQIRTILIQFMGQNYDYPWKIEILNGYGKEGKISAGAKTAKVFMNEIAFYQILANTKQYIDEFSHLVAPSLIRSGLSKIEEYKRSGYDDSIPRQVEEDVSHDGKSLETKQEVHPTKVQFVSDFIAMKNGYAVQVLTKGKNYKVYCRNVTEEMRAAKETGAAVTALLYQHNRKLVMNGLV